MKLITRLLGIHDAFDLYGRPSAWTWDPREPNSLMFAYPVGPQRDVSIPELELPLFAH